MKKISSFLFITSDERNIGYLLLRVFVGIALMTHGIPKIAGGPERWESLGGVMGSIGIPGPAVFWGFMAAVAESVAALFLVVGAFTTISSFLIVVTMAVAAFVAHARDPFATRELALFFLFSSLLFMLKGAGRYSMDGLIRK